MIRKRMPGKARSNGQRIKRVACLVMTTAIALSMIPFPANSTDNPGVSFFVSSNEDDARTVDVLLSFNIDSGESAVLEAPDGCNTQDETGGTLTVELPVEQNPSFVLESLEPPDAGWKLTALESGEVSIPYQVRYVPGYSQQNAAETPGGPLTPRDVAEVDLKVFVGSDLFICPRLDGEKPLPGDEYVVDITLGSNENALAPWENDGSGSSFIVKGKNSLLENIICWGRIDITTLREEKPHIVAGFSRGYERISGKEKNAYGENLVLLYDELAGVLGNRAELDYLTVLFAGAGRYGLERPGSRGLLDSMAVFHGGSRLEGPAAAAAAAGLFDLWNRWGFVPVPGGEADWFQEGLSCFYPYRCTGQAGLMDSCEAFEEFSMVYAAYLTDPMSLSTPLVEADVEINGTRLVAAKGATLCAAMARKLSEDSGGKKSFEWFLSEISRRFDHSRGKDYELVDITELCEEATGKSWDRFFNERVRGCQVIGAGEFSTSELFGSTSIAGSSAEVDEKGSGNSWLFLLVAAAVILLIPVIFSAYVKRSVKLDIQMPKIFPDDDEQD